MKYLSLSFFLLFSLNAFTQSILLKGGLVHSGTGESAQIQDILISGNIISRVGNNLAVNGTTKIIELNGLPVTPGLISPTSNLGIVEINALDVTRDDESDLLKAGFSIFNAFNPHSTGIPWNRSNGVTSAITSPGSSSFPLFGMASYFVLDGSLEIKGLKDVAMFGRMGSSYGSRAETLSMLESLLELGQQASSMPIEEVLEMRLADQLELQTQDILALKRLVNNDLPFVLETNRAVDILQAIALKKKYGLNLILASVEEAPLVINQLKASNTPVIIDPMDNIPDSFDELGSSLMLGKILDEAGIKIMFSTQRSHNYHLMRQGSGNAVAYGMSYETAIQGMTQTVAETFKLGARGTITQGKIADIVVWNADPLEPSSFPEFVYIAGKVQDLSSRATRLTERYTNKENKPSAYKH
ncbi:amidohydrolase family protein [Gammaproteobacteria bacterium]|nr:amidohydrolase family protein [Gammaproteobacteria bacterium]MDB9790477.1 amidohydrolase family protein [Gammaproteobacteria bacterium]MDC0014602.1 amidohydrolase family protein [Gammaproteobacteria bacterium]MDC1475858.1 amidohydrolase family protein [Gammaproteobacteria bacterium]MDC1525828.1 amidohydrolase family protein [Gammaproteobacteria bacterium]|tara:strand:+ start:7135 stop:8376 length:1242 start_codon:yes stop_codon:yes gene_type:complete